MTEPTPDANWPSVWTLSAARMSSFWAYREAGYRWPLRSPRHYGSLSTSLSCASSECRFSPNWPSARLVRAGCAVINDSVVRHAGLNRGDMDAVEDKQRAELQRRSEHCRRGRDRISLAGRTAVIVDDGIATGATVKAACQVARTQGASTVALAVPSGAAETIEAVAQYADEVVCLATPKFFFAVGQGYRNFR